MHTKNPSQTRRGLLTALAALAVQPKGIARVGNFPALPIAPVVPGYRMRFPLDHGAHPAFRTEWWYVTGWLSTNAGDALGFHITFFRTRPRIAQDNPSAFTPRQLLIAHAALTDPRRGRLQHDQRIAREGFTLAGAETGNTHAWIDDWSLEDRGTKLQAVIPARDFGFEFAFLRTQDALLNGDAGFSRKGLRPDAASYYYSVPHLTVSGTMSREFKREAVTGSAWLDHEWSSSYLEPEAVGWDWIGINADDGGALIAFRMRDRDGNMRWAGATYRGGGMTRAAYDARDIRFLTRRLWRSPRTGTNYPIEMEVKIGAIEIELVPLIDDQELDARLSTGTVYWEGPVRATRAGKAFGKGYLELTGYWRPLQL